MSYWRSKLAAVSRFLILCVISIAVVVVVVRFVEAGSLNPTSAPASTMKDLDSAYDALVGASYDSSAIASSSSGSAIQLGRCILENLGGGSCN